MVVIVPTVVATDAPCTGLSVIYNDDKTFNSYLFYPKNPEAVIVDSEVIANAPVKFLVAGMGDALGTHFTCCGSLFLQRTYGSWRTQRSPRKLCRFRNSGTTAAFPLKTSGGSDAVIHPAFDLPDVFYQNGNTVKRSHIIQTQSD